MMELGGKVHPHWNEMLPGDTFVLRYLSSNLRFLFGHGSNSIRLIPNTTYLIVSRRIGNQHPVPRDRYVILGPNVELKEILL